ncbi:MAG: hypothetical protein DMG69_17660 [Acidobacteria bacterium]|nr:MAG: hypothetical protein DMG69_17660 [Acidobacteriota bacterium]
MIIPTTRTAGRVQRSTRKSALPGWLSDNERSKINGMSSLPIRRLQFFTIHTKNLETARQFYVDRLGFPIMSEQAGEYFQVAIAGVPGCVDLSKNNEPAQPNQIGIEVTDVDTITATLRNQGLVVSEGSRAASTDGWFAIHDPDGHELIFIAS